MVDNFQKAIFCNSLAALAHVTLDNIATISAIVVSCITGFTLIPKALDAWDEMKKRWKD